MYQVMENQPLFYGTDIDTIKTQVLNIDIDFNKMQKCKFTKENTNLVDLLMKMLKKKPDERITIPNSIRHAFFNKKYPKVLDFDINANDAQLGIGPIRRISKISRKQ